MHKPIKYVEKGLTVAAKGAWTVFNGLNSIRPAEARRVLSPFRRAPLHVPVVC